MKNSVQITILSTLAMALTAGAAFADFRPGRVRPGVVSEMRTVEASGIYERETGARVEMNFEDGKAKPVSFTLKRDGKEPLVLLVENIQTSGCGDTYTAHTKRSQSVGGVSLQLVDYSNIKCRIFVANEWHVSVAHDGGRGGQQSLWKLEGRPEALVGTLSTSR